MYYFMFFSYYAVQPRTGMPSQKTKVQKTERLANRNTNYEDAEPCRTKNRNRLELVESGTLKLLLRLYKRAMQIAGE